MCGSSLEGVRSKSLFVSLSSSPDELSLVRARAGGVGEPSLTSCRPAPGERKRAIIRKIRDLRDAFSPLLSSSTPVHLAGPCLTECGMNSVGEICGGGGGRGWERW